MSRAIAGRRATAFAPGSIGNVGPGFDVLGLAFGGLGDTATVELTDGPSAVTAITGRDAELVPADPDRNCAAIAAQSFLRPWGVNARLSLVKGLPIAGGMGGSAASSVAGAFAAHLAIAGGDPQSPTEWTAILAAALEGEAAVAGRHLDNIAPSALGGLALSRSVDPIDAVRLPVTASWWIALVTPQVRIQTRDARALLPELCDRATWIQQMANTTALAHAFAVGDAALLSRALDDRYAEPHRAALIPRFELVKAAALTAGAYACSISGSGPTLFAIAQDEKSARECAIAMQEAFGGVGSSAHVGPIDREGARRVEKASSETS